MRRLLISTAALALLAAPTLFSSAWAQPDDSHRIGKAAMGPQVQDRAQAELRQQDQPQQAGNQGRGDRGGNRGAAQPAAPAAAAQATDRGKWQGRGTTQATAPQDQGNRDRNNGSGRGNWQGGQNNGRDVNRSDNYQGSNYGRDNRGYDNRNYGSRGYDNRDYGNPGYGGQRRDYSSFHEFHRMFNAPRRFHAPYYRRPQGWYDHRWSFGEFLPRAFWMRDYWLDDFAAYGLPPAPYGTVWVRVGNDALLVDRDSGEIITVEYSVFY